MHLYNFLISQEAKIDSKDKMGGLLISVINGCLKMDINTNQITLVSNLINKEADVLLKDKNEENAFDLFQTQ